MSSEHITHQLASAKEKIEKLIEKVKNDKSVNIFEEYNPIKRDCEKIIELLIFSLITEKDSFYGQFLIRLNRKTDITLHAPAAVNFEGLYFNLIINPIMLFCYPIEEMKAILIHEIYHICNNHITRGKMLHEKLPHKLVNIAADLSINQFIPNIPVDGVHLHNIEKFVPNVNKALIKPNQSLEDYLEIFKDVYNNNEDTRKAIDGNSSLSGDGEGNGSGSGGLSKEDLEKVIEKLIETYENSGRSEGNNLDDHDSWDKSDTTAGDNESKNILRKIFNEAKNESRGNIPGKLQEMIDALFLPPSISWQQVLKRYIGQVPVPYKKTITRKDRRQPNRADIRGRLNDHEVELFVALDTSGSMTNDDILYALSEISHIVKNLKSSVTIIECDWEIGRVYDIKDSKNIQRKVTGRGGTCFRPVFEYITKQKRRSAVLIYFTDGGGESNIPKELLKHFKTLWVLTDERYHLSVCDLPKAHGEVKVLQSVNERKKK